MSTAKFEAQAAKFALELNNPVVPLETLREILTFLHHNEPYSKEVTYIDLCAAFTKALKRIVNPYRHRTILEKYRDAGQLNEIKLWLQLWLDALAGLDCTARHVPEWHRTYDAALYRVVSALIRQLKEEPERAAEGWEEAATICREWLNRNDTLRETAEYKMLEEDYYFFEGRADRTRAESLLDRRPRTTEAFNEIGSVFARALSNMERAGRADDHPEIVRLKYFIQLCKYRASALRRDFPTCSSCLDELSRLAPITKMKYLPYFGQPEEIDTERFLLKAFEALADRDVPRASQNADHFRLKEGMVEGETIRAKILGLRQVAIEMLEGARHRIGELDSVWGAGVGLGRASRFIVEICRRLCSEEIDVEEAREMLLSVFPLDAFPRPSDYRAPIAVDVAEQVPAIYKAWLSENLIADQYGKSKLLFLQWLYIANIAEYLCGLYRLQRDRGEVAAASVELPSDFCLLGFRELKELLESLQYALDWKHEDLKTLIEWTAGLSTEVKSGEWDVGECADRFLEGIGATAQYLFPHVVKVVDKQELPGGRILVRLEREWSRPQRQLALLCLDDKGLRTGRYYFLKAPFKWKFGPKYDEDLRAAFNFHPASTFCLPLSSGRCCVLVEGKHDAYACERLLDEFAPYWRAKVELRFGGGDSLPAEWERLRGEGFTMMVIADGDKKGRWDEIGPFWLEPDFEGVDAGALGEAIQKLWGDSIGPVTQERVAEVIASAKMTGSTVNRLRSYFQRTTRTFSLPEENEMKRQLRTCITDIWIRRSKMPAQIAAPLSKSLEVGFGFQGS